MNNNVIPAPFTNDKRIAPHRRASIFRLVNTPASRISQRTLDLYSMEEQVTVFQIAMEVLESEEFEEFWDQMDALKSRLQELLTDKHWALLGKRSLPYYQRFPDIATRDEFISEAYKGLERGLLTYDPSKGQCREGGCKVTSWLNKQIELRIKDFISENGGHFKVHPRNIKWRTYLTGGYDNRPEYKKEFEEKHGLTTDEARAALRQRYEPMLNLTPLSLHDQSVPMTHSTDATLVIDRISDQRQIERGNNVSSSVANYTSGNMENRALIADFARHCDPDDLEIWLMVERDSYNQPEIMRILGKTKQEVLNAYRRVQRVREDYVKKVEAEERRVDQFDPTAPPRSGSAPEPPRRRGRPSKLDSMCQPRTRANGMAMAY